MDFILQDHKPHFLFNGVLIIEMYPTTLWFIYECPLKTTRALQFAWCHSNCKDVIKGLHYLLVNKNAVRIYWWKDWPRSTCFLLGTDLHQSASEPIGTYWNLLELIRTQQNHFKLIRTSLNLSEPLWTPLNLSRDPRRDVCIQFFIKRKQRFGPGWSLGSI